MADKYKLYSRKGAWGIGGGAKIGDKELEVNGPAVELSEEEVQQLRAAGAVLRKQTESGDDAEEESSASTSTVADVAPEASGAQHGTAEEDSGSATTTTPAPATSVRSPRTR